MKFIFFYYSILFISIFSFYSSYASNQNKNDSISILFYNVENLFDLKNDSTCLDDEFTPKGNRYWNYNRLNKKLNNISKAIIASNNWEIPDIIGLAEVENKNIIKLLISKSLLRKKKLKVLHRDSKDKRGIDVCLLYNPEKIILIEHSFIEVKLSNKKYSRDILYAQLKIKNKRFHVFVCHWPSRYLGELKSEKHRETASQSLVQKLNEIPKNQNIIIMGDFNDEQDNKSIKNLLKSAKHELRIAIDKSNSETLKYKSVWNAFDHFIVSGNFQKNVLIKNAYVGKPDFLFIKDSRFLGKKPFRTYSGYKYLGGYSDHLPILLKLIIYD